MRIIVGSMLWWEVYAAREWVVSAPWELAWHLHSPTARQKDGVRIISPLQTHIIRAIWFHPKIVALSSTNKIKGGKLPHNENKRNVSDNHSKLKMITFCLVLAFLCFQNTKQLSGLRYLRESVGSGESWPEQWSSQGLGAWTPTKLPRSFFHSDNYGNDDDDDDYDDKNEDNDDHLPVASYSAQSQFLGRCEQVAQKDKQMSEIWKCSKKHHLRWMEVTQCCITGVTWKKRF